MAALWKVYLAILLITTAEGGMNAILPLYLDAAHYSVELIGIVTALFAFLSLASRLPSGALYSVARARLLLVVFTALYILSTFTFGLSTDPLLIFPLTIFHGFAFGAITTIMLPVAIQLHSRGESQGARMGWYTAALSAGYALGAFVSGVLVDRFNFSFTFYAIGLLPFFTIVLSLGLPDISPLPSAVPPKTRRAGWRQIFSALPSLSPSLLFATLVAFYINFLDDGFGTFFPLFGTGLGMTIVMVNNLKGIKSLTGTVVRIFSGNIFKFVDYRLLNHALVIGWSLAVFFLPWVREPLIFVALFIFMGLARSLSRVTSATIVADEMTQDASGIGIASGIYNMGLDIGSIAGPVVAGFVAGATGIPTMMRIISLLMVAIYFSALLWLNRASARAPRLTEVESES